MNTLEQDKRDSLKTILDSLEEWTRPKSDEIAAFTHLRALNQGNKTLSSYIQEVRRMVDLCNFSCVGDCKDRLIRNSIVAGLSSTKAYQQCISKGSNLTLNECIRIAKPKMQPGNKFKPSDQSLQTAVIVPHYTTSMNFPRHTPGQASGAGEVTDSTETAEPATEVAQGDPGETKGTVLRLHAVTVANGPTKLERIAKLQAKSAHTVVDLDISLKCVDKDYIINRVTRLQ